MTKLLVTLASTVLWTSLCSHGVPFSYPKDYPLKDGESFDYVVVGGGAAGSAAAARLALAPAAHHVLLVEAGGNPTLISAIPAAARALIGSSLDWDYPTISNNVSCLAYSDKACRIVRGKCLGGTTTINLLFYIRGNPADYDDLNIPGWSWDELMPYFLRFEGFQDINRLPISSRRYHNTSGIMKLGFFPDPQNPWERRFVEGYRSIGLSYNPDQNAGFQIGVSNIPGYVYRGLRMGAADAYLTNENIKRMLNVSKHTLCTGLMIDKNNVTTGITVVKGLLNKPMKIYARKEVILSAGTIGTPQILMLSGIGPADHLRKMGISVRADLPVGDNMSDHVLPLIFLTVDGDASSLALDLVDLLKKTLLDMIEFIVRRSGPFASNNIANINTFINSRCYSHKTVVNDTGCHLPTIQLSQQYINKGLLTFGQFIFQKSTRLNDNVISQLAAANKDHALINVLIAVLRPFSRGTVRLASSDPLRYPDIYPNFLGDSRDVDEVLRAIVIIEDLVDSPVFKKNNASILRLNFPDCPGKKEGRKYWRCYVRHMTSSVFHAVGTCGMRDVVDERLRVRRVNNVRVADLSVLPDIPRGNTEAIALVIGEKVADLVSEDDGDAPTSKL